MSSGPTRKVPKVFITDNTKVSNPRFRSVDEVRKPKIKSKKWLKVLKRDVAIPMLVVLSILTPKPLRPMLSYLKERLSEKSTYQGIIGLTTAIGVSINPELLETGIAVAVALISFIEIMRKENAGNSKEV